MAKPSPAALYQQTGGGQAYIDAMREHGYIVPKDKVVARHRPDGTRPYELEAGDYAWYKGQLWVVLPDGCGAFPLSPATIIRDGETVTALAPCWTITVHLNEMVTVSPSISNDSHPLGWHGYLEHGIWRPA